MYVHALACTYPQLALSIQLNSISATTYVQRSAIEYIHQLHMFNAAQLGTVINRVRSAQRNWVHSSQRNWVHSTDSIVLKIWTALHLPSHIKFRHPKRVAIENLLFGKLLVFGPLLSSSKYVVGVMATAQLFVASVSKQMPCAHFIAMAEMVVRSAYILDLQLHHQVFQSRTKHKISSTGAKLQSKTPSSQYTRRCLHGYRSID